MQGSGNEQMRGIIPRAVEQVGATKLKLIEQGWEFEMKVQFIEIYNEVVRDLLNESVEQGSMRILRDAYGMTEIEGVTMVPVNPENKSEIDSIMDIAARNRSVCKTDMNAESSRSHSIFTLHLVSSLYPLSLSLSIIKPYYQLALLMDFFLILSEHTHSFC